MPLLPFCVFFCSFSPQFDFVMLYHKTFYFMIYLCTLKTSFKQIRRAAKQMFFRNLCKLESYCDRLFVIHQAFYFLIAALSWTLTWWFFTFVTVVSTQFCQGFHTFIQTLILTLKAWLLLGDRSQIFGNWSQNWVSRHLSQSCWTIFSMIFCSPLIFIFHSLGHWRRIAG